MPNTFLEQLKEQLHDGGVVTRDYLKEHADIAVPTALALGLGAAGASALARHRRIPGETEKERRHRILRDSTIGASLLGGATASGLYGWKQLNTAQPADQVDPVTQAKEFVKHPPVLARLGLGGAAGALAHYNVDAKANKDSAQYLMSLLGEDVSRIYEGQDFRTSKNVMNRLLHATGKENTIQKAFRETDTATRELGALLGIGKNLSKREKVVNLLRRNPRTVLAVGAGLAAPEVYKGIKGLAGAFND